MLLTIFRLPIAWNFVGIYGVLRHMFAALTSQADASNTPDMTKMADNKDLSPQFGGCRRAI